MVVSVGGLSLIYSQSPILMVTFSIYLCTAVACCINQATNTYPLQTRQEGEGREEENREKGEGRKERKENEKAGKARKKDLTASVLALSLLFSTLPVSCIFTSSSTCTHTPVAALPGV